MICPAHVYIMIVLFMPSGRRQFICHSITCQNPKPHKSTHTQITASHARHASESHQPVFANSTNTGSTLAIAWEAYSSWFKRDQALLTGLHGYCTTKDAHKTARESYGGSGFGGNVLWRGSCCTLWDHPIHPDRSKLPPHNFRESLWIWVISGLRWRLPGISGRFSTAFEKFAYK